MALGMFIAENTIIAIDGADLRIEAGLHPWYLAHRAAVERAWAKDQLVRPFLFNGTIFLHRDLAVERGRLTGTSHAAPYAALRHWLSLPDRGGDGPGPDAWHLFAVPVMVSSDGALILGRMSPRTANPGKVYCPSGSLDESDARDGLCDLAGNMAREVREETGLDLSEAEGEAGAYLFHRARVVTLFRRYRFPHNAQDMAAAIRRHIGGQGDPEITEPVIVRDRSDLSEAMPPYMRAIVAFHFDS